MYELYGNLQSPSVRRVAIALAYKSVSFSLVEVSSAGSGAQVDEAEFRTINPQGLVPVFADGDVWLSQSLAILEYIDDKFAGPKLMPDHYAERAKARQYACLMVADAHSLLSRRVGRYAKEVFNIDTGALVRWHHHWWMDAFDALELLLAADRARRRFALGDAVSIADICIVPALEAARRVGVDTDEFPCLLDIEQACHEIPAFGYDD